MALIPGLRNDLVLTEVLPPLPFHEVVASVLRELETIDKGMDTRLRKKVILEGLVVIALEDGSLLMEDPECSTTWCRLPTLDPEDIDCIAVAVTDGVVVAWSSFVTEDVFKLELSNPVFKWDRVEGCPSLKMPGQMPLCGEIYMGVWKAGLQSILQYSIQTGQVLEHKVPQGLSHLWCAGDYRHLHGYCLPSNTILEFDTVTLQWKQEIAWNGMKEVFAAGKKKTETMSVTFSACHQMLCDSGRPPSWWLNISAGWEISPSSSQQQSKQHSVQQHMADHTCIQTFPPQPDRLWALRSA